jgi:exopolyphosphatase/guanosine-5'-triphosphate,3'-diphosphate pyrophosphatase
MLAQFRDRIAAVTGAQPEPSHLLGTSGTVTTIAGVQLGLQRYDRSKVDGCWLDSAAIGEVTGHLLLMSHEQRARSPCIGRERADLVLAGCAILEEIRDTFPCPRIRVADRGLREGILTLMMKQDGTYGRGA